MKLTYNIREIGPFKAIKYKEKHGKYLMKYFLHGPLRSFHLSCTEDMYGRFTDVHLKKKRKYKYTCTCIMETGFNLLDFQLLPFA